MSMLLVPLVLGAGAVGVYYLTRKNRGSKKHSSRHVHSSRNKSRKIQGGGEVNKKIYPDGVYEGDLKNDKREGYGKMTYNDGDVYEGQWKYDKMNGQGKMTYSEGGMYEGEWEDNGKYGKGKMIYPYNRGVYEGEWAGEDRHGHGKMIYPNGKVYEGEWEDDEQVDHRGGGNHHGVKPLSLKGGKKSRKHR